VVVGSGLGGLECARQLAAAGWSVQVLSPGRPGHDGATHRVHALAPWVLLTAPWVRGDSPERFLADLERRGEGQERFGLAEVLAAEAHDAACRLLEELDLERLDPQPVQLPGDEVPRGIRCLPRRRHVLLAPLISRCRQAGAVLVGRTLAAGLLVGDGRVAGVVAIDRRNNLVQNLAADAVVLACGGLGAVFPVATEPRWCRGSGVALAAAGGALLHRPELTQALPVTATRPLYFPTSAAIVGGRVHVDGHGLAGARDLETATREIADALARGQGVWLEAAGAGEGELPLRVRRSPAFRHDGRIALTLALHHGIGGVAIDAWGRTSLPGLYACGEAAGGVQGRRRTMGTGLLEAAIFAGRVARAVSHDAGRLGEARAAEVCAPAVPGDVARLEERLDALMGPLVALRPAGAVGGALRELEAWPSTNLAGADSKAVLAGLRLRAAIEILRGEEQRGACRGAAVPLRPSAPEDRSPVV